MDRTINTTEMIETGNIPSKDIDTSKIQNDIQENLNDTNLGKILFDLKKREKNGTIYKYMGIKRFRKMLMGTIGTLRGKDRISDNGRPLHLYSLKSYDEKGLENEIAFGKRAEVIHMIGSIACAVGIAAAMMGSGNIISISGGINISLFLINFYCTILQRYNRGMLTTVLQKKKAHNASKNTGEGL